jgi:hypothetical protein
VPPVNRVDDPAAIAARPVDKPFASIDFDFRLHRDTAAAPTHTSRAPARRRLSQAEIPRTP